MTFLRTTLACLVLAATAQAWELKYAPVMTDWAQLVDPANPKPEYPRPQMVRERWMNLNGLWEFQAGAAGDAVPANKQLSGEILVPFPMESAISGVKEHHPRSWYRRTFTVPSAWNGQRIILHFDAVDWESEVFINGASIGVHKGGYDAFSYDVTAYLNGNGPQELIVRVYDPTDNLGVPRGKQTLYPGGIMYTSCSGIWQTVWMEPVSTTSISSYKLVPDIDAGRAALTVNVTGPTNGITVWAKARAGASTVSTVAGAPGALLNLSVPNPNLWSPTNPFLYDLDITLSNSTAQVDSVASYFGMRKISLATNNGFVKMLLNNNFVFQFGPLDQGFWPDGIYTAPSDDALKSDIEQAKALGYNMIRKHIKVEPARWYYWADRLGMLVWQDMPSPNSYTGNPQPLDVPQFKLELTRLVENHWNCPSIIMWVIFNESQAQHDTESLVQHVKTLDPSRLINQASGGSHYGVGDVLDWHSYPNPSCPSSDTQIVACGEFGGVGLPITNHTWAPGWGYVAATNGADLAARFEDFCFQLAGYVQNQGLSAAVYTEITDVEIELNGFLTYDRKVRKLDINRSRNAMASVNAPVTLTTVVPTSQVIGQNWKYRTTAPSSSWTSNTYNDSTWSTGAGGFGANNPPNTSGLIRTPWTSSDIWLRRTFSPGNLTQDQISNLFFMLYHDEDVEIYINGVLAASATGYRSSYGLTALTEAGRAAIIPNGNNLLAVHCHQTGGGQYIDVGLVVRSGGATVPLEPVPSIPTGVRAAAGQLGVSVAWDSALRADSYNLKRSSVSGGPYTNVYNAAVNAATDATVKPGTTYYYVVSAVNGSGETVDSPEVSATTPSLPPSVLKAWFRADTITGIANGRPVASWMDFSGNGFSAVQTQPNQQPTYISGAMNGLPVVRFSSIYTNYLAFPRPVEDDFTIFCVFRSSQGIGTGTQFYQGAGLVNGEVASTVDDFGVSLNSNGRVLAGTGNPDVTLASAAGFNDGQPHLVTFKRSGINGALTLYIDGALQGSTTAGTRSLTSPSHLVMGAQHTLINFLNGDIAEVKIFGSVLSDEERQSEEGSLLCKYAIGTGVPPAVPQTFQATPGNRQVDLTWAASPGASSYFISWSTNGSVYVALANGVTGTSYGHTSAANGLVNYYRIVALNGCGQSPAANASVLLPLPTLTVSASSSGRQLRWPSWASDWSVWAATNLTTPVNWVRVTNAPVLNGDYSVTLPATDGDRFYRLGSPEL